MRYIIQHSHNDFLSHQTEERRVAPLHLAVSSNKAQAVKERAAAAAAAATAAQGGREGMRGDARGGEGGRGGGREAGREVGKGKRKEGWKP